MIIVVIRTNNKHHFRRKEEKKKKKKKDQGVRQPFSARLRLMTSRLKTHSHACWKIRIAPEIDQPVAGQEKKSKNKAAFKDSFSIPVDRYFFFFFCACLSAMQHVRHAMSSFAVAGQPRGNVVPPARRRPDGNARWTMGRWEEETKMLDRQAPALCWPATGYYSTIRE